ncbi:MAG: cytochrome c oxidase assembly protein [Sphingomonas fennica]
MATAAPRPPADRRNRRVGLVMALVAAAMVGLGFASSPLYRMFCQVTGYAGTPQKALGAEAPGAVGKIVNVRFDSNVAPGMGWRFEPEQKVARVAVGARQMAFFSATNETDHPITGSASFNVSPDQAGPYFTKIQCFCFTEQTLRPHETVRMPVVYYLDPALLKDKDADAVSEITLSYTFFPVDKPESGVRG